MHPTSSFSVARLMAGFLMVAVVSLGFAGAAGAQDLSDRYDTDPDTAAEFGGPAVVSGPVVAAGGAAPADGEGADHHESVDPHTCEVNEQKPPAAAIFGGGPVLGSVHPDAEQADCEAKAEAEKLDKACKALAALQKNGFGGTPVVSETGGIDAVDLCKEQAGEVVRVTAGGVVVSAPATSPVVTAAGGAAPGHAVPLASTGGDLRFAYLAMALLGLGFGAIAIGAGARRRSL